MNKSCLLYIKYASHMTLNIISMQIVLLVIYTIILDILLYYYLYTMNFMIYTEIHYSLHHCFNIKVGYCATCWRMLKLTSIFVSNYRILFFRPIDFYCYSLDNITVHWVLTPKITSI